MSRVNESTINSINSDNDDYCGQVIDFINKNGMVPNAFLERYASNYSDASVLELVSASSCLPWDARSFSRFIQGFGVNLDPLREFYITQALNFIEGKIKEDLCIHELSSNFLRALRTVIDNHVSDINFDLNENNEVVIVSPTIWFRSEGEILTMEFYFSEEPLIYAFSLDNISFDIPNRSELTQQIADSTSENTIVEFENLFTPYLRKNNWNEGDFDSVLSLIERLAHESGDSPNSVSPLVSTYTLQQLKQRLLIFSRSSDFEGSGELLKASVVASIGILETLNNWWHAG